VHKSSVYLPDHLKRALARTAAGTGRSEAEVIRAAIEAVVGTDHDGHPRPVQPPRPGYLVGVGVGPGSPDLLTVRALDALRRADRVVAPATAPDAVGRAESIVRQALAGVRVTRLPFAMEPDRAARDAAVDAAAGAVCSHLDDGEEVAFITLGDPLTYSTFTAVAASVRRRRPSSVVESVPGIMAFQELASITGTTVVDERQSLSIRTALEGDEIAAALTDRATTFVLYKGGRRLPELSAAVEAAGRSETAVAGELLGLPGERVGPLTELADGPASYLATVIVPADPAAAPAPDRGPRRTSASTSGPAQRRRPTRSR